MPSAKSCMNQTQTEEQLAVELASAAGHGDLDLVKEMIEEGIVGVDAYYSGTPLSMACKGGHLDVVKYLVRQGANPNYKMDSFMETPVLFWALKHIDIVKFLVNDCEVGVNQQNNCGTAPLMLACSHENASEPVIRFLLEKGADVNALTNEGLSACVMAADQGHLSILKILHEAGADVDAPTNIGATPLFYAAGRGYYQIVKFLVAQGADVEKRDNSGQSAAMLAKEGGADDVVEYLLKEVEKSKTEHGDNILVRRMASVSRKQEISRTFFGKKKNQAPSLVGTEGSQHENQHEHQGLLNKDDILAKIDSDAYKSYGGESSNRLSMPPLEKSDELPEVGKTKSKRGMSVKRRQKYLEKPDEDEDDESDDGDEKDYPMVAQPQEALRSQQPQRAQPVAGNYGGYAQKGQKQYAKGYGGEYAQYGTKYAKKGYGQKTYNKRQSGTGKAYADRTKGKIKVVTDENGKLEGLRPVGREEGGSYAAKVAAAKDEYGKEDEVTM